MNGKPLALGGLIRIKHGYAFKGEFFTDHGKYVVLTPGHFFEEGGFRDRPEKDRFYNGDIPDEFVLPAGTLIVAMTEQGPGLLGSSALVPEAEKYLHNQRIGLVTITAPAALDKNFLYRLFNTRQVRAQINGSASGTKVRHTAPERIYRVLVSIPSLDNQRRIATILAAYDSLIENNRRRIKLLDDAARLLYREWFGHFRFPGHEHVRIVGGVMDKWERSKVGDLVELLSRGITPTYDDEASGLVINQKCIREGRLDLGLARRQSRSVPAAKLVRKGDVLINSTGAGTLGRVAQVGMDIANCTVDSHVTIARPNAEVGLYYFGMSLKLLEGYISNLGRGATNQTELSRDSIAELPLLLPPTELVEEYEEQARCIETQISALSAQNVKLREARDLLLPKLMSGELEV